MSIHRKKVVVVYMISKVLIKNDVHIQIPLTSYIGLINTAVATASQSTFEGIMKVLCSYCMHGLSCHRSMTMYHHSSVIVPSRPWRLLQLPVVAVVWQGGHSHQEVVRVCAALKASLYTPKTHHFEPLFSSRAPTLYIFWKKLHFQAQLSLILAKD